MAASQYLYAIFALVFVLALVGVLATVARRLGFGSKIGAGGRKGRRLGIVETMSVDAKRRLVLVRRDATEHLILMGPGSDLVVEGGIPVAEEHLAEAPDHGHQAAMPARSPGNGGDRR